MIPKNLIETTELVFDICGFQQQSQMKKKALLTALVNLSLMELRTFRLAKITPTKLDSL
jgi:hypothetical protein